MSGYPESVNANGGFGRERTGAGDPSGVRVDRVLWAGAAAGTGDLLLALVLYRVPLGRILQSIAAGLLGRAAFDGGIATAVLGLVLHFFIATTAAAVYAIASRRVPHLARWWVASGLLYGIAVYLFMKYVVLPSSAVPRLTPFDPWAMAGHALLVGLPIALIVGSPGVDRAANRT